MILLNRLPQNYDSEILIKAVTALDWNKDPSAGALKTIQATIHKHLGESLSSADAAWLLGSLLDRRLIRMEIDPDEVHKPGTSRNFRRRGKYIRVPPRDATH